MFAPLPSPDAAPNGARRTIFRCGAIKDVAPTELSRLGRRLVTEAEEFAWNKGCDRIEAGLVLKEIANKAKHAELLEPNRLCTSANPMPSRKTWEVSLAMVKTRLAPPLLASSEGRP